MKRRRKVTHPVYSAQNHSKCAEGIQDQNPGDLHEEVGGSPSRLVEDIPTDVEDSVPKKKNEGG